MYYHKRFQQQEEKKVKKFELKGRFSFLYVGNGNVVYTIPGKNYPKIGRIDLSDIGLKRIGIAFSLITFVFFIFFLFFTKSGGATTNNVSYSSKDNSNLNSEHDIDLKNLDPQEIERRSEQLKNKLLQEDKDSQNETNKAKIIKYTVKNGDSLNSIANKFKVPVKFILKENGLKVNDYIYNGQVLNIPNRPGIFYSIKKGDRLSLIAEKYQVSINDIIADNDDLEVDGILQVGKKVFLPNAVIPEPPPIWVLPAYGKLTSFFGYRKHPIFGYTQFHGGIDISLHYQPVMAARDGVVHYAGYMGGYGLAIILNHGKDYKTLYAHLSKINVRQGQFVKAGTKIAISGNTGFSTGPHLHFEVLYKGTPVNPLKFFKFK